MEYQKSAKGFNGLGLAGLLTGGAALLGQASGGNGMLGGLFGANNQAGGRAATETLVMAPLIAQAYASAYGHGGHGGHGHCDCGCDNGGGYVTKEVLTLVQSGAGKDAEIAQLKAERYADAAVRAATDPLVNRVCALETAAAVNAARDADWRKYVNAEFIHQPKARITESIVVCEQCGCRHDHRDRCECGCC